MLTHSAWILFSLLALWQQRPSAPAARPNATAQTAVPQQFRISGVVEDGTSGLPVERAEVSLVRSGVPSGAPVGAPTDSPTVDGVAAVMTSAEGRFVFEHVAAGKYLLSAKRQGYAQQNYQQHEIFSTAIAVGPQLDSENIVFELFPAASIVGQVGSDSGEAVRRAQVIMYAEGHADGRMSIHRQTQTQTDDQGHYRFGGLPKGRYYVAVSAHPWYAQNITTETMAQLAQLAPPDPSRPALREVVEENTSLDVVYPLTFYGGTTDSAKATTIGLEPGEMVTADISLAAVAALHLRLTAPGLDLSQPLNVSVSQSAFGLPGAFAETAQAWRDRDSIGIVGVPPGEIRINAQSVRGGSTQLLFNETLSASQGMEINLNHQARGIPVSGLVKIPRGSHLPERTVLILRDVDGDRFSQALIQADGSFNFGDFISPGRYVLSLAAGSDWYVGAVQADGAEASGRVVDLQTLDPVRLTVEIAAGLGRVEGVALRDGKGVGGAMIMLVSRRLASQDVVGSASVVGRDQSDSDGTFAIANVPPGDYTVLAIENGWDEDWGDPDVVQAWLTNGGTTVTVAPNGKPRVQVNLQ